MGQIFMGEGVKAPDVLEKFEKEHANDFHAGWIETSSMLAISEDLVRETYKDVPDSDITDRDMIFKKKQIDAMGQYGNYALYRIIPLHMGFLPVLGRVNRKKVTK